MQMSFFNMKSEWRFGGTLLKAKRKSRRPLSTKHAIHVVLSAKTILRRGTLLKHQGLVRSELTKAAKRWGIRIYKYAIEKGHIHLLVRIPTRAAYKNFIQRATGAIALKLKIKDLWDLRPFTRIVNWGKDFKQVGAYIEMNFLEAEGFIDQQPRGKGSKKNRDWWVPS